MNAQAPNRPRILLADDDPSLRMALTACLNGAGYEITPVASADEAIALLDRHGYDLVVSDMRMPGGGGDAVLAHMQTHHAATPLILMSGDGDISEAVTTLRRGAEDYLVKPFNLEVFEERVARILIRREAQELNPGLVAGGAASPPVATEGVIAVAAASKRVLALADNVAASRATVLLVGESGTGKERVARYLHQRSDRASAPFVAVNCAAIPENLLESELFGHEKGSFSGASARRLGRFEQAHGGTILLDEISEMDLTLQAKLLRVLQEFEVDRVGGDRPIAVDVRVICTTNRDLRRMVDEGLFREDLYYRIHVFPLRLPPLRDRKEDIPELASHFVHRLARANGRAVAGLTEAAVDGLLRHDWPGNVRDLENTLERAVLLCEGSHILPEHLLTHEGRPLAVDPHGMPRMVRSATVRDDDCLKFMPGTPLAQVEQTMILHTLRSTGGNRTHTSRLLGISIRTLRNRLKEYRQAGIDVHPPPAAAPMVSFA